MKKSPAHNLLHRLAATALGLSLGLTGCSQASSSPSRPAPGGVAGFGGLGGGPMGLNPDNMVANLDEAVMLTPEQRVKAQEIFEKEAEALNAMAPAERFEKGMPFRQAARDEIRALLTPEQQKRQDALRHAAQTKDAADRAVITSLLRSSPGIATRLGPVTSLSLLGSSTTDMAGESRTGQFTYTVVGGHGSETLKIYWEKKPINAPIRLVRIEGSDGTIIQP